MEAPLIDISKAPQYVGGQEMPAAIPPPAYTPHSTVEIQTQTESAEAATDATDSESTDKNKKELNIVQRFGYGVVLAFWLIVFVGGLMGSASAVHNSLYMFIGSILWTAFTNQGPSNVLDDLFSPTNLLYMKLTAFGGALLGFWGAAVICLAILPLLPFWGGRKDMKEVLKEKYGKPLKAMQQTRLAKLAKYALQATMPPLAAYIGMGTIPWVFGPGALVTADGETVDMTRALVSPVIGLVFAKLFYAAFTKLTNFGKKAKVGDEETQSQNQTQVELENGNVQIAGSSTTQVQAVAPQEVRRVEKPLIDV